MLLTKTANVKWYYKTKEYYENKGYVFTKFNDIFEVSIEDLYEGSSVYVEYQCDFCGKKRNKVYKDYTDSKKNDFTNKDACRGCYPIRKEENMKIRQRKGILKRNDPYYWKFKENRLEELKLYIEKHGTLDSITMGEGIIINQQMNNYKDDLEEMVNELGYSLFDLVSRIPIGYYDDFNKLEKNILVLIEKYSRFPRLAECQNEGISQYIIDKHGGIDEIKRKMKYYDDTDLIDDRGWYNKSSYEYMVAQFLISYNIPYKREQYPFPNSEREFRSDFTLFPLNKEPIHVEVWGYNDKLDNDIEMEYSKRKKEKKELYEKYGVNLISIEKSIFKDTKYHQIIESLYIIFKDFLEIKYVHVEDAIIIPTNLISDEELFDKIMEYSDNDDCLPNTSRSFDKKGFGRLYKEIIKRYDSFSDFGKKFNMITFNEKMKNDKLNIQQFNI
ncbi:hypothetical protein BAOM_3150 [Peribacillus asahii]|uniref:Uncharacterized protein n=1 Tax=Peribacillus asahii TaxID=228899 RepID=A0A3Q9RPH2_9BACI|nr:hypothetical protein [Peribacillus asahii]AZV43759.1 hypothetical protein BAOM_3150 [Peribacillus asahii]